jgi:hypothetical protein
MDTLVRARNGAITIAVPQISLTYVTQTGLAQIGPCDLALIVALLLCKDKRSTLEGAGESSTGTPSSASSPNSFRSTIAPAIGTRRHSVIYTQNKKVDLNSRPYTAVWITRYTG